MQLPAISIVVPTCNRLPHLKKCVEALLQLSYHKFEIIIVNDASTDDTKKWLSNLKNQGIKVIHNQKALGASDARNAGIMAAKYPIIAFTDDDCLPHRSWLKELARGFSKPEITFVIGATHYRKKNYRGHFPERLVSNPKAHWPMTCNIAYRKSVLTQLGGFDPFFFNYHNEDSELAIRAVAAGHKFARAAKAVVFHQAQNWTVTSLLASAPNAAVWPILKQRYPKHFATWGAPMFGPIVHPKDYLYLLISPILIPLLLIRYLWNGKRDLKLFFAKWPGLLILRRLYVWGVL